MAGCSSEVQEVCNEFSSWFHGELWGKDWFADTDRKLRTAFPDRSGCLIPIPIGTGCLQKLAPVPGPVPFQCAAGHSLADLHRQLDATAGVIAQWAWAVTNTANCIHASSPRSCAQPLDHELVAMRRYMRLVEDYPPALQGKRQESAEKLCKAYRAWARDFWRWGVQLHKWENGLVECMEQLYRSGIILKNHQVSPPPCPPWERDENGKCPPSVPEEP